MAHEDLQQIAQKALTLAKKSGCQDAMARVTRTRDVEYEVRNGEIEEITDSTSLKLSLTLFADGRYSQHMTSDLREAALPKFIEDATLLTRAVQADPFRRILPAHAFAGVAKTELDLFDPRIQGRTRDQRLAVCYKMNEVLMKQANLVSASSSVSDEHRTVVMVGTNGFQGQQETTSGEIYSGLTISGKNGRKVNDGFGRSSVRDSNEAQAIEVSRKALDRAVAKLDVRKGPTAKTHMVVDRLVASRMINQLLQVTMGSAVQQQRSFLANRLGQKLFSDKLSILDEPLLPQGYASRLWDSEGFAAKAFPVIEQGVLRNFYLNDYYAQKLKLTPTADSPSNVVMKPGKRSGQQIVADIKNGIYVSSWNGGNMDPTTGDFSLGASGFVIRNGQLAEAVNEMNVTGHMLELFTHLVEVGNDPWEYGGNGRLTPTLAFEGVQFSGA